VKDRVVIGTRGSQLALWQANWVSDRLRELRPGLTVELQIVKTIGDQIQDRPLEAIGVRGAFTKELDHALLEGSVDLVVHSLKDVPTEPAEGTIIASVPLREDPRDAFIGKGVAHFEELPQGAVIATGSLRRQAQIKVVRPDISVEGLRGNIDTRLRKLRESATLHGIILARAGVKRLGLEQHVTQILELRDWLPAPGQGALGIATRARDVDSMAVAMLLDDAASHAAVDAERALLARLEGGCHVPIGTYASVNGEHLSLDALVASPDGTNHVRDKIAGGVSEASALGLKLAERLLENGGRAILAAL
jgi:hydroxymethylbilane synthase